MSNKNYPGNESFTITLFRYLSVLKLDMIKNVKIVTI